MTGAATTKTQHLWTLSISRTAKAFRPISAICNGKEVESIQTEEPFLTFWYYPLNKCRFSFLLSWMSSALTLKILNPHANLYLQLCLLFGPLDLKMFTWGPKSGKFYPYFIQPYILTQGFCLLSVESNEYEISLIPSDMEPNQIILGPMALIKAVLVAGDSRRAGHMPFGPGSLVSINGHSTSLQQHGSHSLSPAEDWLWVTLSLLTKQFQGCKEPLPFLLWSASLHPCSSFVHLLTSSRHRLQLPYSISVPLGLFIWHRPETKQINQIMGHSRDLGPSLYSKTLHRAKCAFLCFGSAGPMELFPRHIRSACVLLALLTEWFLLLCTGREAAWIALPPFNFHDKFRIGASNIIGTSRRFHVKVRVPHTCPVVLFHFPWNKRRKHCTHIR